MTAGDSKAALTITPQPALAPSPQPRPAPTARALPPGLVAQVGQNWTPIVGQNWMPIDTRRMRMMAELGPGCVKKPWGRDAASTALVLAVPSGKIAGICSVTVVRHPRASWAPVRHDGADLRWSWPPAERQRRRSLSPALCYRRAR